MTMLQGAALGAAIADQIAFPESVPPKIRLLQDPILGVLKIMGGVGLYLVSNRVDPVHWGWVRTSGYGASIALGVAGLADLLRVDQKESV